jgi:hypothetical protein
MPSPTRSICAGLGSILALAAALSAQRTWIVDPENRPGTDFTDLPPAIAAASPGDKVVVRQTFHLVSLNATTDKGITILGPIGPIDFRGNLAVRDLPAGQRFVMRDFTMRSVPPLSHALISVDSCAGTVHLEAIGIDPTWAQYLELRIAITDSDHATVRACSTNGQFQPGLTAVRSTVLVIGSHLTGSYQEWLSPTGHYRTVAGGFQASSVLAVDSGFHGGWGIVVDPFRCWVVQNRSGISLSGGRLALIGPGSAVTGGAAPDIPTCQGFLFPAPAIVGSGVVVADPAAQLAPPPAVMVTRRADPVTRSSTASSTGHIDIGVAAQPNAIAATFAAPPGTRLPTPFGDLWLDANVLWLIDLAVLDAGGGRSLRLPLNGLFAGEPLAFQTAILAGDTLLLTVPSVTVVAP